VTVPAGRPYSLYMGRIGWLSALILLASAGTALAQPGAAPHDSEEPPPPQSQPSPAAVHQRAEPAPVCALGRALPYCKSILHMELTIENPTDQDSDHQASASIFFGLTVNTDEHNGVGGLLGVYGNHPYGALGFKARYRRWLSPYLAADLEAGVMLPKEELGDRASSAGWTLGADLDLADCVALTSRVDVFDAGYGRETMGTVGVRIGTVPLWAIASTFSHGH